MITIDTEILRQLAMEADSLNQNMTAALQKVNSITGHNDWNCKERVTINQKVTTCKKYAQKLTDATNDFTRNMKNMVSKYDDFKTGVPRTFANLESLLSKKMSIKSLAAVVTAVYPATIINSIVNNTGKFTNYVFHNIAKEIKVCKFDSFDFK